MGKDQRGFPRSLVDMVVKTRVKDQWVDSKVLDLSVEGISLEVPQPLETGEMSTIELEHSEWMKKNQVQAEVLRCDSNPDETEPRIFHVVARLIEPNDDYLMGALNLVHGTGPKKDRREPGFGKREDGR
ncbi:MAG: PilZ domain-containing protein [Nitrospinae bacterium]|nr:PilZ domain-containing protein [Nitrospinota bacterium]MBL7019230.1 PilZ domain-containing protein [Nitrospinaceae bacterium]